MAFEKLEYFTGIKEYHIFGDDGLSSFLEETIFEQMTDDEVI